jgi:hypothetical protein
MAQLDDAVMAAETAKKASDLAVLNRALIRVYS